MGFTSTEKKSGKPFEKLDSQIRIRKIFQQLGKTVCNDIEEDTQI